MRAAAAVVVVVAGLLVAGRAAAGGDSRDSPPGEVIVTLDGQGSRVRVFSVEGDAEARPDDLVPVGERFVVPRGSEARLRFRTDGGKLWQIGADKTERLVGALAVARKADGSFDQEPEENVTYAGEKPVADGLCSLTDDEFASLRSVCVMGWSDEIAAKLAKADLAKTCIVVARGGKRPIPPLPAGAQFVALRERHFASSAPGDLAPLATLRSLRFLALGGHYGEATDLTPLAGLAELRHLDLDSRDVAHTEALAGLKALRVLSASGCKGLDDVAFAASMPGLRTISIGSTKVGDLSPLSDHAELRVIDADLAPVRVLPKGDLRALRSFRLLSAPVPREDVEAFVRERPDCKVVHGWRDLFIAATAGSDRVRVRSGGICHRRPIEEKTLLELTTPVDVAAFVDLLRLDESAPGGACMCCGSPTFEFYAGKKLLASLGYHHGKTLRWPGGAWPGDALVDAAAADRLCEWLAKRGVTGPMEERDETKRRTETLIWRDARQTELLTKDVRDAVAADAKSAAEAFARRAPDAADRVLLLFRLLGCAGDEDDDDVTNAAKRALDAEEPGVVVQVGKRALDEDEGSAGVARWLFGRRPETPLDDAALDALVPRAAMRFLADPDPKVRGHAIYGLRDIRRPVSIELLRKVLAGSTLTSPPAPETERNVGLAVFSLIELGDGESLPRMREIVASWDAEERADFEKALARKKEREGGK